MPIKEFNMTRIVSHSVAAFAAVILAVSSIGAIVTVPPAQAMAPVAMTELA